ncbi:MAG TPA: methanogenesis marker 3 protein, partial [Methanocorpusculum sp.]|nr:methanogenesis marker 3 protein [Methanocorpusculum sp.]
MTSFIQICVNGEEKSVTEGTTLAQLFPDHPKGAAVVINKVGDVSQERTSHMRLKTTAGDVIVEVAKGVTFPEVSAEALRVHFEDKNVAVFGPFPSNFIPAMKESRYSRGTVFLGSGGYDAKTSYLMFSRNEHMEDHGSAENGGIIGKVIFGLGIMNRWTHGDKVLAVEQIFFSTDASAMETITDLSACTVEAKMQIFSELTITAEGYAEKHEDINTAVSESVDHMLFVLQKNLFTVDRAGSTYIRCHRDGKLYVPQELQKTRHEGAVTVRTKGNGSGAIYIYTSNVASNPNHTAVGSVSKGIELAKFAKAGTTLKTIVVPKILDFRGMLLKNAVEEAKVRGLKVMADNRNVDGRIVIDQKPAHTLDILREEKISLYTVALDDVIDIALDYENAPLSVDLFRRITGLKRYPVGTMPFIFSDEGMYLFKPNFARGVNIIPENCPKKACQIDALALTNDSRPAQGVIGVRLAKNNDFGPTGEPFNGTNMIGRVIDTQKLERMHE